MSRNSKVYLLMLKSPPLDTKQFDPGLFRPFLNGILVLQVDHWMASYQSKYDEHISEV